MTTLFHTNNGFSGKIISDFINSLICHIKAIFIAKKHSNALISCILYNLIALLFHYLPRNLLSNSSSKITSLSCMASASTPNSLIGCWRVTGLCSNSEALKKFSFEPKIK